MLVTARIFGYGSFPTFSYGLYDLMYWYTSADSSGLPHSSHSVTVSGSDGSRMDVSGSTNGTCATMPAKASGATFAIAPMNRPPAEPPRATSRSAAVHEPLTSARAQATKSVKV